MKDVSIIKARGASVHDAVRPFLGTGGGAQAGAASAPTDAPSPQRSAMVDLIEQIALRDAEIAKHGDALAEAHAKGVTAGRADAEDEFEDSREEALETLRTGVQDASARFEVALKDMEALAILIAVEAVDKLCGDAEQFRAMLVSAVATQVRQTDRASLISVTASRADFPDTREVAALAETLGMNPSQLIVQDDLDPGDCRINLGVGALELGLRSSWDKMKDMLNAISDRVADE
jgi:flagellar biosynthesis/type III secretory pathway protein FliH